MELERARMKQILSEAITVLCKASLSFTSDLSIEGLLGITLDKQDIILVNINEAVQKDKLKRPSCFSQTSVCPKKSRCSEHRSSSSSLSSVSTTIQDNGDKSLNHYDNSPKNKDDLLALHDNSLTQTDNGLIDYHDNSPSHKDYGHISARTHTDNGTLSLTHRNSESKSMDKDDAVDEIEEIVNLSMREENKLERKGRREEKKFLSVYSGGVFVKQEKDNYHEYAQNKGTGVDGLLVAESYESLMKPDDVPPQSAMLSNGSVWDSVIHTMSQGARKISPEVIKSEPHNSSSSTRAQGEQMLSGIHSGINDFRSTGTSHQGAANHLGETLKDGLHMQQRLYTDDLLRMQMAYRSLYQDVYPDEEEGEGEGGELKPKEWVANAVRSQAEGGHTSGQLSCQFCGRTFDAIRKLKRHIIIHSSVRYKCRMCPKSFTHPEYLSQHIKVVHAPAKKHRCPYCNRILSTRQRMKLHSDKCPYKPMDLAQRSRPGRIKSSDYMNVMRNLCAASSSMNSQYGAHTSTNTARGESRGLGVTDPAEVSNQEKVINSEGPNSETLHTSRESADIEQVHRPASESERS